MSAPANCMCYRSMHMHMHSKLHLCTNRPLVLHSAQHPRSNGTVTTTTQTPFIFLGNPCRRLEHTVLVQPCHKLNQASPLDTPLRPSIPKARACERRCLRQDTRGPKPAAPGSASQGVNTATTHKMEHPPNLDHASDVTLSTHKQNCS